MMDETVLSSRYSLLAPVVCRPVNNINDVMFIDNFRFFRGQDLLVEIYNADIPEGSNKLVDPQMRYPAPYAVSDNYNHIRQTLVLNLLGERVVYAFGVDTFNLEDDEFDEYFDEIFERFGFVDYSVKITFDFEDGEYFILFSEMNEDGNYYVFSHDFNTIVEISPEEVPFVEWDLLRFIDRAIFMENIDDVEMITVKSPGAEDVVFTLEGSGQELQITAERGGGGSGTGGTSRVLEDVRNFRQFYIAMLSMDMWEYEEDTSSGGEPMCELIINMRNGEVYDFKFYFVPTNTRRCFFTLNGSGQFYVMRDRVLKLINDTAIVFYDEPVDGNALE
jgi:hypothetical protein